MQVSIEAMQGLERRLTIALPAEKIDSEVNSRLSKLRNTAQLKGFRPGKVPAKLINSRFSESVRYEVIEDLMRSTLNEALTQENLKPAGMPRVEPKQVEPGKPFEYTAIFEVFPEITLQDLANVELIKTVATVSDKDVDVALARLQKLHAKWTEVQRAAKNGDQVIIDFAATVDGEPLPGGTAKNYSLELGSKSMIPGFEEGIVGIKADATKTLKLTFPEKYHNKDIAGKVAEFNITVHKVNEAELAPLDDSLAKKLQIKEGTLAALRAEVLANMSHELDKTVNVKLKQTVFEKLMELNPVILPKALIEAEIHQLKLNALEQMRQANVDPNHLPNEPFQPEAERRVHIGLLVNRVREQYSLTISAAEVRARIEEHVSVYEDAAQVANHYFQNKHIVAEFQAMVLEEKVIAKLLENAIVKEEVASYSDVMETEKQPQ